MVRQGATRSPSAVETSSIPTYHRRQKLVSQIDILEQRAGAAAATPRRRTAARGDHRGRATAPPGAGSKFSWLQSLAAVVNVKAKGSRADRSASFDVIAIGASDIRCLQVKTPANTCRA